MRPNSIVVLAILATLKVLAADVPPNPGKPKPGMEGGAWSLEAWGNSGAAEKAGRDDNKTLQLIYTGGPKDKTAFKHLTCLGVAENGKFRMHVYCAEDKPPQIGLAISTTLAYRWHESKPREVKKGWNKFEFSVGDKDWKTEASKWEHTVSVSPCNDVRSVDIVVYNGASSGVLNVQALDFDPDAKGQEIAKLIKEMQSDDPEQRAKAETAIIAMGRPATEALYQLSDDERPEVLLRAASALRRIEDTPEQLPADPKQRTELLTLHEEQNLEESRRRAENALEGMTNVKIKLLNLLKEAQTEANMDREELGKLQYAAPEKRKAFAEAIDKLDAALKENAALILDAKKDEKKEPPKP